MDEGKHDCWGKDYPNLHLFREEGYVFPQDFYRPTLKIPKCLASRIPYPETELNNARSELIRGVLQIKKGDQQHRQRVVNKLGVPEVIPSVVLRHFDTGQSYDTLDPGVELRLEQITAKSEYDGVVPDGQVNTHRRFCDDGQDAEEYFTDMVTSQDLNSSEDDDEGTRHRNSQQFTPTLQEFNAYRAGKSETQTGASSTVSESETPSTRYFDYDYCDKKEDSKPVKPEPDEAEGDADSSKGKGLAMPDFIPLGQDSEEQSEDTDHNDDSDVNSLADRENYEDEENDAEENVDDDELQELQADFIKGEILDVPVPPPRSTSPRDFGQLPSCTYPRPYSREPPSCTSPRPYLGEPPSCTSPKPHLGDNRPRIILKCDYCVYSQQIPNVNVNVNKNWSMKLHLELEAHYSASVWYALSNANFPDGLEFIELCKPLAMKCESSYLKSYIPICPDCGFVFENIHQCACHYRYTHSIGEAKYGLTKIVEVDEITDHNSKVCKCGEVFKNNADLAKHRLEGPEHELFKRNSPCGKYRLLIVCPVGMCRCVFTAYGAARHHLLKKHPKTPAVDSMVMQVRKYLTNSSKQNPTPIDKYQIPIPENPICCKTLDEIASEDQKMLQSTLKFFKKVRGYSIRQLQQILKTKLADYPALRKEKTEAAQRQRKERIPNSSRMKFKLDVAVERKRQRDTEDDEETRKLKEARKVEKKQKLKEKRRGQRQTKLERISQKVKQGAGLSEKEKIEQGLALTKKERKIRRQERNRKKRPLPPVEHLPSVDCESLA